MQSNRVLLILLLLVLGVGAIGLGLGLASDAEAYVSSSLLEIGATLLLVVPLIFVERILERRVESVRTTTQKSVGKVEEDMRTLREEVDDATSRIGELSAEFRDQLDARHDEDERAVATAKEKISWQSIASLFDRARSLGSVSAAGIRVKLPGLWERVRFRPVSTEPPEGESADPMIWLSVEDAGGGDIGVRAIWKPGEKAVDPLLRLVDAWQKKGTYPGGSVMDPDRLYGELVETFALAIRSRTGERGVEALHPLIEKVNSRWAITDFGLEYLGEPDYPIKKEDIVSDPAMRREHMLEKTWVLEHADEFREAFQSAELFFKPEKRKQRSPS